MLAANYCTADFLEKQEELKGKVMGAMAYPGFLAVMGFVAFTNDLATADRTALRQGNRRRAFRAFTFDDLR